MQTAETFIAIAGSLPPGRDLTEAATIPTSFIAGRYRIVKDVSSADGFVTVTAEFDVIE